ncbi:2-oxo-4-hydroxy-4-carboxy-5-ureidoimidazoline decarboxylase [Rhodococcus zopfii]|uniref:2-oxo-4-hydroxy-4-carboxy-5-ureidoimidazoline decarboxylase n=1 Tax=Rhodococcus zopfii TaxID=43772 RepID=A0ABU3WSQ4_9NOCA|nr:2-oxo-4-hydroxy-4-carboxy-5-ureidoimidazoline decarboxylase [Rhodococcus zopfii]MDV2477032.1 2-oxo-4-hydroxy-4-carboxy-5-ureidoimidazoline decarboxylase [Rhodococcus zopfii]
MLLHQGIGLGAFNALSRRGAVHALYECCASLGWANPVAAGRPYASHTELFARADAVLVTLDETGIADALDCHPIVGGRPRSAHSRADHSSMWDEDPQTMAAIAQSAHEYEQRFGFRYLWCPGGRGPDELLADLVHRLGNDVDAERKIRTDELAKVTRTRLERMLGPEDGFPLY